MISPDTSGILVDGFEGGASCDCILKTDAATHRKSFPSCMCFVMMGSSGIGLAN